MISSTRHKDISLIRELKKHSSARRREALFIAEGKRFVADIIKTRKGLIQSLYYCEEESLEDMGELPESVRTEQVAPFVMESMSDTKTPQGVLATVRMPDYDKRDIMGKVPFILVLEDIRDPGNIGTMFRMFEAAGGTGIILAGDCTDPFSPKSTRATMGSIVRMPFIRCRELSEMSFLDTDRIRLYTADTDGTDYDTVDYTKPCAFVIGNEANGVSKEMIDRSYRKISVPMKGCVESLNAAVTAAILSYEVVAQRRRVNIWK